MRGSHTLHLLYRFMGIAEQMGRVLQRTSISVNIKERLDFSCALFGPDGSLVANAPHLPVHLGAMSEAVRFQVTPLACSPLAAKAPSHKLPRACHILTCVHASYSRAEQGLLNRLFSRNYGSAGELLQP